MRARAMAKQLAGSTWFLGSLIGIVAWRPSPIVSSPGYDGSFHTALSWATEMGLDWGTEFIYTYGPLGFAEYAVATLGPPTAVFSALYLVAANLALGITMLWAARRMLPLAPAVVLAAVIAVLVIDMLPAIGFLIGGLALAAPPHDERPRLVLSLAGPPLLAISLLTKINEGILIAALVTIALVTVEWGRPRRLLACAIATVIIFTIAWFGAGQSAGNLDDYVRGASEITRGYAIGQVADDPQVPWDRWAAAAMVLAVLAATVVLSTRLPTLRRAGLVVLVAILCFVSIKHGFTRHSPIHLASFVQAMLLPWLVLPWMLRERIVPVAACAAIVLLSIPMLGSQLNATRWDLLERASAVDQVGDLLIPSRRDRISASSRRRIRSAYRLPSQQLAQLRGYGVHIVPQEVSVAWAYGLDWQPLPIFDPFTIYQPSQDRRNARALSGDDPPERILRYRVPATETPHNANFAIDNRYLPWNMPQTSLRMYCNYRAVSTSRTFQVLAHQSDRCGAPRTIARTTTSYGEAVAVPRKAPPGVLLARVEGLEPTALETLKRLAYRGDKRSVTLDDDQTYDLLGAMAPSGLVVRIPTELDFPSPFRLAPDAKTLRFDEHSSFNDGSSEIEIEWVLVPVTSDGADRRAGTRS